MYLYGKYLEKHEKIFHNLKESFHYIKLAVKDVISIILSNKITLDNKAELAFYLKKGADNNNLKAMHRFGRMLIEGDGIPKDYEKGIEYIKNAAAEGYFDAMSEYVSDIISKKGIVNYDFEHFKEESRKYQQILLDYKSDNSKVFIDENFPPFKTFYS